MSDSQRFPVAAHALAYLAHKGAFSPQAAVSSAELACSIPTNPVVVRRTTALLAKAGLIGTRTGAGGGAWLQRPAESITLDQVLRAVHGCAHLGAPPPAPRAARRRTHSQGGQGGDRGGRPGGGRMPVQDYGGGFAG